MWLEWLVAWSWSLDGLRDCIATGIQSVRDCDGTAVITVACLLVLFVWYCYHVGREQPRPHVSVNSLLQGVDANGLQNGSMYCQSPECVRCTHHDGLNQKLYHNLQEYAKRYSWSGMGRIHKGIREQGRYLSSQPSIQKPEVFFLPDLPTTPYFPRDAQKHDVELLERNFQAILCEFEALYKAFSNCSLPQGWKVNSTPSGEWFTFDFVSQGVCVPRNCRKCPRTYRLLGSLRTCIGNNVFGNACISVLSPGTVITEHYGPTNIRIRCHLGTWRGRESPQHNRWRKPRVRWCLGFMGALVKYLPKALIQLDAAAAWACSPNTQEAEAEGSRLEGLACTICVHLYACVCRGQRSASSAVSQALSTVI